jgi:Tfp pilus assembly protein PilF
VIRSVARRSIDRAIRIDPNSRDAYYELSPLLMKKGNAADAVRAGERP